MGCLTESITIDLISMQSRGCFHLREAPLTLGSVSHSQAPLVPHQLDRLLDYRPRPHTCFLLPHPKHVAGLHNLTPYPIEG